MLSLPAKKLIRFKFTRLMFRCSGNRLGWSAVSNDNDPVRTMKTVASGSTNERSIATHRGAAGSESLTGVVISLAFWFSLLAATAAFAAVGLSPKLMEKARLAGEYTANHERLLRIERENEQLQRVIDAIRNDPEFASELKRVEFDAVGTGEEIIPVDTSLKLEPREIASTVTVPVVSPVWYQPLVAPFAERRLLRQTLLAAAAALIVVSFTWFQPGGPRPVRRTVTAGRGFWQTLRARYVRPTADSR
jgi:cell division protein FtsB